MRKLTFALLMMIVAGVVRADVKPGDPAPPMPVLTLSDGSKLDLQASAGKVIVLTFYEQSCPTARKKVSSECNQWAEQYKGQPVRFVAIGAGDSVSDVRSYIRDTRLRVPVAADPMSALERSWGLSISLKNIVQTRVIGPDGTLSAYRVDGEHFERALKSAKWKYDRSGYDAALYPVLDRFEWGEEEAGAKLLRQAKRSGNKALAESATKFGELLTAESQKLFDEAGGLIESDPCRAFDLLTQVAAVMDGEPLGRQASDKLKTLRNTPAVRDELAARKMYDQLASAVARARDGQQPEIEKFGQSILKKYPNTPTAKRVEALLASVK